jgi:hypothetical protein
MVINLNEINRLLVSLRELRPALTAVPQSKLRDHLSSRLFLRENPDFEPVIDFALRLGLISRSKRGISITKHGAELLSHNPEEFYELRPIQRTMLVRSCYLDGPFRREIKRFAKKFSRDDESGHIIWSSLDSEPMEEEEWLADHLIQLGVVLQNGDTLFVTDEYKATFLQLNDEGGDYTEEQLKQSLQEKLLLAEIAEMYVFRYEQERLRKMGHAAEAACVRLISKIRVNAGYDINSYNGASKALAPDRFIEVKGSGQRSVRFIWSPNEMKKAALLKDSYWIYFVGEIDRTNRLVKREPVMIQNPQEQLAKDSRFRTQSSNVLVEADFAGPRLHSPSKIARKRV